MFNKIVTRALPAAILAVAVLANPARAADVPIGDDGLHKPDWLRETFFNLSDDLAEANAEGKRMLLIIEQKGCIYCAKLHEQILPSPDIDAVIRDSFYVEQINMFGDLEMTDFDGTVLSEKDMVRRWGLIFTPTLIFLPEQVAEGQSAVDAAVAVMPGAFEHNTTLAMFEWVRDKAYLEEPNFQRYFADHFLMDDPQ